MRTIAVTAATLLAPFALLVLLGAATGCESLGVSKEQLVARNFTQFERKYIDKVEQNPTADEARALLKQGHADALDGHFTQTSLGVFEDYLKQVCSDGTINDTELSTLREEYDRAYQP